MTEDVQKQADRALKFLEAASDRLNACKTEIEANWRLQIIVLAAGIVVLIGWDAATLKALLFDPPEGSTATLKVISRAVVSLLLVYYFFRFGTLLGEYRDAKLAALLAKAKYVSFRPEDAAFVDGADQTVSQFEFFFKRDRFPAYGILAYLVSATALMHAMAAFLAFDALRLWAPDWSAMMTAAVAGIVFAIVIGLLYVGHWLTLKKSLDASKTIINTVLDDVGPSGSCDEKLAAALDCQEMTAVTNTIRSRAKGTTWATGLLGAGLYVAAVCFIEPPKPPEPEKPNASCKAETVCCPCAKPT